MHRVGVLVLAILGMLTLSALSSAQDTLLCCTDSLGAPCDCAGYVGCLDTLRLVLSDTPIKDISFSQSFCISHGLAFFSAEERPAMPPDMLLLPPCEVVRLLLPYCRYQLTIDGSLVETSFIGLLEVGGAFWHLAPYYMFPAGYFAPGVHVLTLTRTIANMPARYTPPGWADLADEQGLVTWSQTDTLTLVVTY